MEPKKRIVQFDGKEHEVVYRDLSFPESAEILELATEYDVRLKELHLNTAKLVLERLKRKIVSIDGQPPNFDSMDESFGMFLATEFGGFPEAPKN